jgi:hypothetical protein
LERTPIGGGVACSKTVAFSRISEAQLQKTRTSINQDMQSMIDRAFAIASMYQWYKYGNVTPRAIHTSSWI